jgi:hypothetical protein
MDGTLEAATTTGSAKPKARRVVRRHAFLTLAVAGALLGGGLRLVPTSAAAPPSSDGAGQGAPASTACAAS